MKQNDKVIKDEESTMLERMGARTLEKARAKGEYKIVKDMLELVSGKPSQHNTNQDIPFGMEQKLDFSLLTDEEITTLDMLIKKATPKSDTK